ncbi:MAG: type II 3-dehydroquinate dehydratase [Gaiellaceae bacterium]
MRVAVLNGVNLDVLGRRSPEHYGGLTLAELESRIYAWSKELECTTRCRQTNHEGQFVEWCHDALDWADGVILNPGAWSHYSYAIRDAVELFTIPVLEVHLSNIKEREEWRRQSVVSDLATKVIYGKGPDGYREALAFLAENAKAEEARQEESRPEKTQ